MPPLFCLDQSQHRRPFESSQALLSRTFAKGVELESPSSFEASDTEQSSVSSTSLSKGMPLLEASDASLETLLEADRLSRSLTTDRLTASAVLPNNVVEASNLASVTVDSDTDDVKVAARPVGHTPESFSVESVTFVPTDCYTHQSGRVKIALNIASSQAVSRVKITQVNSCCPRALTTDMFTSRMGDASTVRLVTKVFRCDEKPQLQVEVEFME